MPEDEVADKKEEVSEPALKTHGKRSRVSELVKESKKPRRSSLGRSSGLDLAIPQPPAPSEPHTALFIFGTGDMGQLGQGPDELDDIKRPKLHAWYAPLKFS